MGNIQVTDVGKKNKQIKKKIGLENDENNPNV